MNALRNLPRFGVAICLALTSLMVDPPNENWAEKLLGSQSSVLSPQSSVADGDFVAGEVLVRWRTQPSEDALAAVEASDAEPVAFGRATRLRIAPGHELDAVDALRARSDVVWAQPNFIRQVAVTPNDPRFVEQWGLRRIDAPAAWDTTMGASSVVVAVVDTGVDLRHPDIRGRLVDGHNFVREDRLPQDDNGHGTHVAGTIAATLNNNVGIAGVAPNVSVMPVKVLGRTGRGADDVVAAGLYWATDHGAWVINMSFGPAFSGTQATPMVEEALEYATGLGAVVVLAAGNRGTSEPPTLSGRPGVISVAATMPNDVRAPFSNHGSWVHVGAPGTGVLSTFFDGTSTYRSESGTSVAAPYVSGVAALLFSLQPGLAPREVEAILLSTADPLPGQNVGAGRLNAARAVAAARDMPRAPTPVPITPTSVPGSPTPAPGSPTPPTPAAVTPTAPGSPPNPSTPEGSAGNTQAP